MIPEAPPELKWAAVYVTIVAPALLVALRETVGGLHRLADATDRRRS